LHENRGLAQAVDGPLHYRGPGAPRERVRDEVVAVATVSEREEDAARLGDARVEGAAGEPRVHARDAMDDPSTRRAKHLLEGEHVLPEWYGRGAAPLATDARQTRSGC